MKASKLRALHMQNSPDSHFFARDTMRFFGDTVRNFGVKKQESGEWLLFRKHKTRQSAAGTGYLFSNDFRFVKPSD